MQVRQEQPKIVLESQPSTLRATLVKYMETNYPIETSIEVVSSKPYYQEEEHQRSYSWEEFIEMRNMGNDIQY